MTTPGFNPLELDVPPQSAPLAAQSASTPPPEPVEPPAPAPAPPTPARTPHVDAKPAATKKDTPTTPAAPAPAEPAPSTEHTCSCGTAGDPEPEPAKTAASKKATRAEQAAKLAARRKAAGRTLLIGAVVIAALLWTKPWDTAGGLRDTGTAGAAGTVTTTTESDQANATDTISQDVTYAEEYLASNGTLDGIIIDGAQLAVRDKTMYAVRTIDGVCTVYGLLNGQRIIPTPDTSGAACAGQIVTVQAQLDAAASQVEANSKAAVEDTLSTATAAAAQYASRNFVGGAPSMTGLPNTIAGAAVMENTGNYALLRVSYPGACLETYVTAAGEVGDTNTCS